MLLTPYQKKIFHHYAQIGITDASDPIEAYRETLIKKYSPVFLIFNFSG